MFDFTPPHLHLLVNHFPVEGSIIAVLLLIFALMRHSAELKRVALIAFVLIGVAAYVSDVTGGGASREVRNIPGVERALIREHAEAADWSKDISYAIALIALAGLILAWRKPESIASSTDVSAYIRHHKEPHKWIVIVCLVGGLLEVSTFAVTAYRGGLIRHPEIQSSFPVPAAVDTGRR
jgi:hypothetical protein